MQDRIFISKVKFLKYAVQLRMSSLMVTYMGQVVIISDTFHELSEPLIQKLGGHSLFANQFELDPSGMLRGFKLRIRGKKERIVSGFKSAGFAVAAMGDSLNDLSLLKSCDYPVLFRPVATLLEQFPGAPVATNFDEALEILTAAWRKEQDIDRNGDDANAS